MEYMLLADGTVRAFEVLNTYDEVISALIKHEGVAYYWCENGDVWFCIRPDDRAFNDKRCGDAEVPNVVKLAAMLE